VKLHIGARQLSYWSAAKHDWVVAGGDRPVYVRLSLAATSGCRDGEAKARTTMTVRSGLSRSVNARP